MITKKEGRKGKRGGTVDIYILKAAIVFWVGWKAIFFRKSSSGFHEILLKTGPLSQLVWWVDLPVHVIGAVVEHERT